MDHQTAAGRLWPWPGAALAPQAPSPPPAQDAGRDCPGRAHHMVRQDFGTVAAEGARVCPVRMSGLMPATASGLFRRHPNRWGRLWLCRHASLSGDAATGFGTLTAGLGAALHFGAAELVTAFGARFADIGAELAGLLMLIGTPAQEVGAGLCELDTVEHQLDVILTGMFAAHRQAVVDEHILTGVTALPAGRHCRMNVLLLSHRIFLFGDLRQEPQSARSRLNPPGRRGGGKIRTG